jgi:quercetin dioxygenase-like cupin family protein
MFNRHRLIVTLLDDFDNQVYDIVNLVVENGGSMGILVKRADARTTVTPNATMTTLASPTIGPTSGRSVWLAEMIAGATGPVHVFDSEQIWTVLDGCIAVDVAGDIQTLEVGDTVVIPAQAQRQIHAVSACRMLVAGDGDAIATVPGEPASRGTPAWIS